MAAEVIRLPGSKASMRELLQAILDDERAVEFAGAVMRSDGTCIPVICGVSRERLAYISLVLGQIALEDDDG